MTARAAAPRGHAGAARYVYGAALRSGGRGPAVEMQLTLSAWSAAPPSGTDAFLSEVARQVARHFDLPAEQVEVAYRRYTTLKSTARRAASGKLVVCLSEDVRLDPPEEQSAIALVLAGRVMGRRPPRWADEAYGRWMSDPRTRERALTVRAQRAGRRTRGSRGRHHDLGPLLEAVARDQFDPPLPPPPVEWTQAAGRAVLASFDEAHEMITVTRLLDHPKVAEHTLRYLLYHEMLHFEDFRAERARREAPAQRPAAAARGGRRRRVHSKSFTDRLHRFPDWKRAEKDLERALRRRVSAAD